MHLLGFGRALFSWSEVMREVTWSAVVVMRLNIIEGSGAVNFLQHRTCRVNSMWLNLAPQFNCTELIRTGTDLAAGTLLRSAWCQRGTSELHSG